MTPGALVVLTALVVAALLTLAGTALVIRDRLGPTPPPRHRAERPHRSAPRRGHPPDHTARTGAAGSAADGDADRGNREELDDLEAAVRAVLDDAATTLTGAPAGNPALAAHPATGATHHRVRRRRLANPDAAPVPRAAATSPRREATDGADPGHRIGTGHPNGAGPPEAPAPGSQLPDAAAVNVANTLAAAFTAADLDTLAALARQEPAHAAAGHLLAAAVGAEHGDPRFLAHLHAAWDTGADPADIPELAPFRDQLCFTVDIPSVHVRTTLPCTRTNLCLALAAAEHTLGDPETAYGILLELDPADVLPALLTAVVAADLGWPAKADQALTRHRAVLLGTEPPGRFTAAMATTAARLHLTGTHDDRQPRPAAPRPATSEDRVRALEASRVVETGLRALHVADDATDTAAVEQDLRYLTARAHVVLGRDNDAWATLTDLLRDHPDHGAASDLIKAL